MGKFIIILSVYRLPLTIHFGYFIPIISYAIGYNQAPARTYIGQHKPIEISIQENGKKRKFIELNLLVQIHDDDFDTVVVSRCSLRWYTHYSNIIRFSYLLILFIHSLCIRLSPHVRMLLQSYCRLNFLFLFLLSLYFFGLLLIQYFQHVLIDSRPTKKKKNKRKESFRLLSFSSNWNMFEFFLRTLVM